MKQESNEKVFFDGDIGNQVCRCASCEGQYRYSDLQMLDVGERYIRAVALSVLHKTAEPKEPVYKALQEASLMVSAPLCKACRERFNKAIALEEASK